MLLSVWRVICNPELCLWPIANAELSRISQADLMWHSWVGSQERSQKDAGSLEALPLVEAWPLAHVCGGHHQGQVLRPGSP